MKANKSFRRAYFKEVFFFSTLLLALLLLLLSPPTTLPRNQLFQVTTIFAEAASSQHQQQQAGLVAGVAGSNNNRLVNANNNHHHYYGSLIGKLQKRDHNVSGDVYAVDEQTLFIKNFNFDGLAPDVYFWSSVSSPLPSSQDGFIVPDEKGSTKPLERYVDKDIVLRLPEGKTLREINWLSVWSRKKQLNCGEILIGARNNNNLITPRPLEISPLSQLAHGVKSGPITIVDAQTFLIPDFHYDGLGPAGFFWLTRGQNGLSQSGGLRLKDENGSSLPLKKYQGETVVISLPDDLTIYDFDYFGVWCKEYQVNFGQTKIPQQAKVPPSPKMLGIKPENKLNCEILYDDLGYEIRWVLDGDDIVMQLVGKIEPNEYMAFGLGKDDSKSDMNNADAVVTWVDRQTGQVHAIDYFLGGKQQCLNGGDNKLLASCPDVKLENGGDSLTLLHGAIVNGYSMVTFKRPQLGIDELYDQHVYSDGQQSVIWAIGTLNKEKEIGYHRLRTKQNMFIDFARNPQWNCPIPDLNATMHNNLPITSASQIDSTSIAVSSPTTTTATTITTHQDQVLPTSAAAGGAAAVVVVEQPPALELQASDGEHFNAGTTTLMPATADSSSSRQNPSNKLNNHQHSSGGLQLNNRSAEQNAAWFIPSIVCPNDKTFYAQIGPSGAHKGYEGLTGRASWGISWYINGLMIPELVLERGQMYRFVVEGGNDKTGALSNRRHPLYLTDSPEGGFDFKTDDERLKERIFAGLALRADGQIVPTAEGRLCEWKHTNQTLQNPDNYATFSAYQRSLKLECLPGQGSLLKFMPDSSTPDIIYYQCYTHRFMGWRIRIVNSCSNYKASLQQQQQQQGSRLNNNIKRELKENNLILTSTLTEPITKTTTLVENEKDSYKKASTYDRRQLQVNVNNNNFNESSVNDLLKASTNSEARVSFEANDFMANSFLLPKQTMETSTSNEIVSLDNEGNQFGDSFASAANFASIAGEIAKLANDNNGNKNNNILQTNDMIILNNSQLVQSQPLNLTSFEEVLKLAPADLEFMDNNSNQELESYFASPTSFHNILPQISPINSNFSMENQREKQSSEKKNVYNFKLGGAKKNSTLKEPSKMLQTYMRRLASIYYPVQQQLASMLAPTNQNKPASLTANQQQKQQQQLVVNPGNGALLLSSASNQAQTTNLEPTTTTTNSGSIQQLANAGFSLSNLVPISKIDLSKSTLTKKLNKLRFKSGRKYEPAPKLSHPPTPANEFNYDIFNNQLAQLKQHEKEFQALEMLQQAGDNSNNNNNLNYLPMMTSAVEHQQQQQAIELGNILNQQQFNDNNNNNNHNHNQLNAFRQTPAQFNEEQQHLIQQATSKQPIRFSEVPLGPPNHFGQQPYVLDYLSVDFNRTAPGPELNEQQVFPARQNTNNMIMRPPPQQVVNNNNNQNWFNEQQLAKLRPQLNNQNQQQHSIFITRLPQSFLTGAQQQFSTQSQQNQNLWPSAGASARYPDILPYNGQQQHRYNVREQFHHANIQGNYRAGMPTTESGNQQTGFQQQIANQMSSLPSVTLSIHDDNQQDQIDAMQQHAMQTSGNNGQQQQPQEVDSLSGSGSGAYYDFRQQPIGLKNLQLNPQQQHLLLTASGTVQSNVNSLNNNNNNAEPQDHMIAIERFSKQPSERRLPSIVHPITGEQIEANGNKLLSSPSSSQLKAPALVNSNHDDEPDYHDYSTDDDANSITIENNKSINKTYKNNHLSKGGSKNQQQKQLHNNKQQKYSTILIEKNLMASNEPTIGSIPSATSAVNDIFDSDQTTTTTSALLASDLKRLNATDGTQRPTIEPAANRDYANRTKGFKSDDSNNGTHEIICGTSKTSCQLEEEEAINKPTTVEPLNSVLVKPSNFFTPQDQMPIISTTASYSVTQPSVGPLTPSFGPPIMGLASASGSRNEYEDGIIFKSSEAQPTISSAGISQQQQQNQFYNQDNNRIFYQNQQQNGLLPSPIITRLNFDSRPFTPIELTNNQYQQQVEASNLLASRLKPPPLIESMLSQHQNGPLRPEPPVQVASYLAQQLTKNANQQLTPITGSMFVNSEKSVASNNPMTISMTIQQQQQQNSKSNVHDVDMSPANNNNTSNSFTNDLIILKPTQNTFLPTSSGLTNKQTFILKPELLTNQYKIMSDRPIINNNNNNNNNYNHNKGNDLFYYPQGGTISASEQNHYNQNRQLNVEHHQFDRLSSLSSPPSTSIALDPMQSANTIQSVSKQTATGSFRSNYGPISDIRNHQQIVNSNESQAQIKSNNYVNTNEEALKLSINSNKQQINGSTNFEHNNNNSNNNQTTTTPNSNTINHYVQHRPNNSIPSNKQIPFNLEPIIPIDGKPSSLNTNSITSASFLLNNNNNNNNNVLDRIHHQAQDGIRLNPAGDNINTLPRDNNTDNAILSHVMSLISSNAIPSQPYIPISSYSSADYFMPISDRTQRSIRGR